MAATQGLWLQMFRPRAINNVPEFLPENVRFVQDSKELGKAVAAARDGKLRLLLECPAEVDGIAFGEERYAESFKARSVVADDWFGSSLPLHRILTQHNFVFREVKTPVAAHLVAARVAGYRDACFGLKDTEAYPLLFEHPECRNILIAATPLASFITSRFAPACDWKVVIGKLLGWLAGSEAMYPVDYTMAVHPVYPAEAVLPENAEANAFRRNAEWFYREMIYDHHGDYGVLEGYTSVIDVTGRQWIMPALRGDCLGECAAVGALDYALHQEAAGKKMAEGLIHTMLDTAKVRDCIPASQTFGSLFFDSEQRSVYGDDNSRAGLGAVLAEELLGEARHAKKLLQMGYSLLRTTGPNGLRQPSLLVPESFNASLLDDGTWHETRTWKYYRGHNFPECRPHYHAWHWAFELELYALTGDRRFRDSAVAALEEANRAFPDFYWQNGATGDWARILLPYAMLVEVEDTPLHRQWLARVADWFIEHMNQVHVAPEEMGKRELGHYPAPSCNADHGKGECALVQNNGDPACDLLYSMNFAFPGMHEAYCATGDARYKMAADGMADFFCRVQAESQEQPYLNGAWLRGFDFSLWEYFGSAADSGWGPWCVETGWTNSWIAVTLALRKLNRPLLAVQNKAIYQEIAPVVAEQMFAAPMPSVTTRGTRTDVLTAATSALAEE